MIGGVSSIVAEIAEPDLFVDPEDAVCLGIEPVIAQFIQHIQSD
jgi:hypothetical protein